MSGSPDNGSCIKIKDIFDAVVARIDCERRKTQFTDQWSIDSNQFNAALSRAYYEKTYRRLCSKGGYGPNIQAMMIHEDVSVRLESRKNTCLANKDLNPFRQANKLARGIDFV